MQINPKLALLVYFYPITVKRVLIIKRIRSVKPIILQKYECIDCIIENILKF